MTVPEDILRKQLDKIAAEENLTDYQIEIKPVSSDGANYLSVNFKAKIISSNRPDLKLFAKVAFFSEAMRAQMPIGILYEKEINVYKQMLSRYEELQEKYGIPKEERYQVVKMYGSSTDYLEECVIMEDLDAEGYRLFDRFQPLTWEYTSKAMEELAKFHALSLALKSEYPEVHESIFHKDEEMFTTMFNTMSASLSMFGNAALSVVPDNLKERVQKFWENFTTLEAQKKYYSTGVNGFIVHGDYRASNIMFKRQGGKIKGFVPLDYQTVRLGSPSSDILYLIYSGTDEKFRKLHLKRLIDLYYNTFATFLRRLNLDPEQEFSRQDFDEDFKNFLDVGLVTAINILPIVMVDPSKAPKTTSAEGGGITEIGNIKGTELYKKRFMPILNEYIKYGAV